MTSAQRRQSIIPSLRNQQLNGSSTLHRKLLRDRMLMQKDFFHSDFKGHFGCVNAIEFTWGRGEYIASGGDDRRVILWNVAKALSQQGYEAVMMGQHNSNIFCISFDIYNRKIFSGGNDEKVITHDIQTGKLIDMYLHEDVIYGLSTDPNNDHVFASACDDGSAFIYDMRLPTSDAEAFILAKYQSPMHSIVYNPVEPRLLATANAKEGIALWDVRRPRLPLLRYGSNVQQSCMSVRFSQSGERIIGIRRRLPLVLYDTKQRLPLCEFDHETYYNSCTMKSCSFAGDNDEFVLCGSDDFNLYMWRIPEDLSTRTFISSAHTILKGHRSIVNQVRSNPCNNLIISSGVEKIIKAWSPYDMMCSASNSEERPLYTHEEYINIILNSGQGMSHDYSQRSVDEEPRMMAFFDSLVQREIEGWSSDELSSNDEELYRRIVQVTQSDDSESTVSTDSDGERLSPFSRSFVTVMASRSVANTPEGRLLDPQSDTTRDFNEAVTNSVVTSTAEIMPRSEGNRSLDNEAKNNNTDALNRLDGEMPNSNSIHAGPDECRTEIESCLKNEESSVDSGHSTKPSSNSSADISQDGCDTRDLDQPTCSPNGSQTTQLITQSDDAAIDLSISSNSLSASSDADMVQPRVEPHDADTSTGELASMRRVYVDMSGSQISVQMLPRTRPVLPENRRRISQLIAWRRQNYNKRKKRTRISSSEDSNDETSVSAVRAKVLGQRRQAGAGRVKRNLRSLVVYSSSESEADDAASIRNNGMTPAVDPSLVTASESMMGKSSENSHNNTNNNRDVSVDLSIAQHRDHDLCTPHSEKSKRLSYNVDMATEPLGETRSAANNNVNLLPQNECSSDGVVDINKSIQNGSTTLVEPCTSAMALRCDNNNHVTKFSDDPCNSEENELKRNVDINSYSTVDLSLPEVDNGNSQPMWAEFKRFKSRMKKAQRYYRQHTKKQYRRRSSGDDNDDDDDDDNGDDECNN